MSRLTKLRSFIAVQVELLAIGAGLVFAASGATVAAVLGKLVIGVVLGFVALGFLLRLKSRGRRAELAQDRSTISTTLSKTVGALISGVEVAALVEATNLPVRLSQPGFHMGHWSLVLLVFLALYLLQLPLLSQLLGRRVSKDAQS